MKFTIDQDGVKHMPKALCTYADHSYPAYTKEQMRTVLEQRDELLATLKETAESIDFGDAQTAMKILNDAIAKADLMQ